MRIPKAAVALVLAVIGTCAVRAPVAYGIDYSWANPVSGSLLDPTKWSPNGVPSLIDTAIFNLGSTGYTVSLSPSTGSPIVSYIQVGNDTLTVDLGQNTLYLAGDSFPTISLGNATGDVADVTLRDGSINQARATSGYDAIGFADGSTATLKVDGSAGTADFSDRELYVGYAGTGTVAVENGGTAGADNTYLGYQSGTKGTITVNGAGSMYGGGQLYVGEAGTGSLSVGTGGAVSAQGITIGDQVGSNGSVTVDGAGSIAKNIQYVGYQGTGTLSVTGGAKAVGGTAGAMAGASGTITVDGAGSSLTGLTAVGNYGTGSLTVKDGGSVTAADFFAIGQSVGGTGSVSVEGAGSSLTADTSGMMYVGQLGSGSLSVTDGAHMTAGNIDVITDFTVPTSTITLDGAGTSLSAGNISLFTGILTVQNGAALSATSLSGEGSVTFDGAGTTGSIQTPQPLAFRLIVQNGAVLTETGGASLEVPVTVDGAGSTWNVNSLTTDYNSAAHVTISNGGAVNAETIATYGPIDVLSGSSLTASSSFTLALASTLTVGANATVSAAVLDIFGTVDLSGGGSILVGPIATAMHTVTPAVNPAPPTGTIQVNPGGVLYGGVGALTGSVLNDGGQVAPVNEHYFHVTGDFTQTSGTLTVGMAGGFANSSSELFVSGNVALSGVLDLDFAPLQLLPLHVGQTFDLISAGGSFSTAGLTLDAFQTTLTGGTEPMPAGFAYTTQFADGVYSLTVTSVPEPSTFAMAVLSGTLLMAWRRRT